MFEKFNNMTHQYTRTSYEQLKDFIYHEQEKLFEYGERRRASINDVNQLKAYNEEMRTLWLEKIGGIDFPVSSLDAKVTSRLEQSDYTIESIIYCSRPHTYVTGSLYLPKGSPFPAPAILFLCGHHEESRMADEYQMVCDTLAKAGLIVFAIDPIGQGERANFYDPKTDTYLIKRTTSDHDACGIPSTATGQFLQRFFLCDEMRAVDYMLTRPEIDPKRIGITGNSGGGTQTLAMMAADDRIAAAAPGTFVTTRKEYMYSGQAQDAEQIWPGITAFGFDHVTPFMIFSPRPVAILATKYDFFPIEGTRETFSQAKQFYHMYGKEDNLRLYEDKFTHCYTPQLAVWAAEFFTEIFLNEKKTIDSSSFSPLPPQKMYATKTGCVNTEFSDLLTVPEETRIFAQQLRKERMALTDQERLKRARDWLIEKVMKNRAPFPFNARIFPKIHCIQVGGYMGTTMSWWTQRRLFSFGDMIKLEKFDTVDNLPTVIAIWEDGTKKIGDHEEWIRNQCQSGKQVLVLDVPGVGQLEQRPMIIDAPYKDTYGTLYRLSCDLLYMGDSMPAMHCYDVLRTIEMLSDEFSIAEKDITLYCEGPSGIYGIMAAFLNRNVGVIYGKNLLLSVEREIINQNPFKYDNTYSLLMPGMLKYFDYEELIR